MSLEFRPRSELTQGEVTRLAEAMAAFYKSPPASYYQLADKSTTQYTAQEMPFHWDLLGRLSPGASVLEVGCGTAHLCSQVESRGGRYTGIDYSENLLADNRQRFPRARFFQVGTLPQETFDVVASLYSLEHVADPPAYLEQLWAYCRPGGMVGIICPEFVDSPGFPPSVFFGHTARRFRDKCQGLALADVLAHLLDLKVRAPRWKQRIEQSPSGAFWLNLRPGVLHGGDYSIDADAIHLTRLKDLVWFFERKGASLLQTSAKMAGVSPELLRYNCYVLAQKPPGTNQTSASSGQR